MPSSPPGDDRLIGRVLADRYKIMELLGEGGMGRVYVAEHVRMGRRSAVKVMSPDMARTADGVARFNREAANAARINHPNVAQIYDFGETTDGVLYLAMEFIEGETLRQIIQRVQPPMPLVGGYHDPLLVPPLQLAGGDAGEREDLVRGIERLHESLITVQTKKRVNVLNIVRRDCCGLST